MYNEGILQINGNEEVSSVSFYNEKAVEHLVDQLIKLQREYDRTNSTLASSKNQINKAMEKVNEALGMALMIKGE